MKKILSIAVLFAFFLSLSACREWDKLDKKQKVILDQTLAQWEMWVPQRKAEGSAPLMTFRELYQSLSPEQIGLLDAIRALHPSDKDFDPSIPFKKIQNQQIQKDGSPFTLEIQYLPQNVFDAYEKMMEAMKKDLGKRLRVESGYRSPAYQLYTFAYYMPKHGYSLKETNRWVALPGHSEHGDPGHQAIDFINEEGIDGDTDNHQVAEDFEKLPEYAWLQKNAASFGFYLSYPRLNQKGTSFEPWHWRFERSENLPA